MRHNEQDVYFLHDDLLQLVLSYVHNVHVLEFKDDIKFYLKWQKSVPKIFLNCSLFETRLLYHVANPMIKSHPYYPRKYLRMRPCDIWGNSTLLSFGSMLCRFSIRDAKTYKRCALRWIYDCIENREIHYYETLYLKLLCKLKLIHFQDRVPGFFVIECLRQISACSACSLALNV